MDLALKNAKVLVIAASQGLGAATARQFSREGAIVVINSRNLQHLQQTASDIVEETDNPVFTVAGDVSDANTAQRVVKNAAEMLGGLDIIITNAGGPPAGEFKDFGLNDWESATQLTLLSAVNLIQAAIPYLKKSSKPAILAITSIAAKQPVNNLTLSNTLRPAVTALMKTLSLELAEDGIRVNSILPGITNTERLDKLINTWAEQKDISPDEQRELTAASIPLRRIGSPEEFANTAVFLCSPAAGFITGVALTVDGGDSRSIL